MTDEPALTCHHHPKSTVYKRVPSGYSDSQPLETTYVFTVSIVFPFFDVFRGFIANPSGYMSKELTHRSLGVRSGQGSAFRTEAFQESPDNSFLVGIRGFLSPW